MTHTLEHTMISEDYAKTKAIELLMLAYTKHLGYKKLSEEMVNANERSTYQIMSDNALDHYRSMREMATLTSLLSWDEATMDFKLV